MDDLNVPVPSVPSAASPAKKTESGVRFAPWPVHPQSKVSSSRKRILTKEEKVHFYSLII